MVPPDAFDQEAVRAVEVAQLEARARGHPYVLPEHLLCALVIVAQDEVERLLGARLDLGRVTDRTYAYVRRAPEPGTGPLPLSDGAAAALAAAVEETAEDGDESVSTGHLLSGLLGVAPDACARVLYDAEAVRAQVRARRSRGG